MRILLTAFFILFSQQALACECQAPNTLHALEQADAVFMGKVKYIAHQPANPGKAGHVPQIVVFQVSEKWKGDVSDVARIHLSGYTDCDTFPFEQREDYLVYAKKSHLGGAETAWGIYGAPVGVYKTSLCMGTTPVSRAKEKIALLRENAENHKKIVQQKADEVLKKAAGVAEREKLEEGEITLKDRILKLCAGEMCVEEKEAVLTTLDDLKKQVAENVEAPTNEARLKKLLPKLDSEQRYVITTTEMKAYMAVVNGESVEDLWLKLLEENKPKGDFARALTLVFRMGALEGLQDVEFRENLKK